MGDRGTGIALVVTGLVLVAVGLLVLTGALGWFGRLPGDLRWDGDRTRVFVPLTSMILVSVALSVLAWLFRTLR